MKITIYGAGAIGGWMGAGLAQQAAVSVVARGDTLAAPCNAHGSALQQR
jgi:2-dehydropantoate 2-reductase